MAQLIGSAAVAQGGAASSAEEQVWTALRAEYVATRLSLGQLAAAYRLDVELVRRRARRERWAQARDALRVADRTRFDRAMSAARVAARAFARAHASGRAAAITRAARQVHLAFGELWERGNRLSLRRNPRR